MESMERPPILEGCIDRLIPHDGPLEIIFDSKHPGGYLDPGMLNRELGEMMNAMGFRRVGKAQLQDERFIIVSFERIKERPVDITFCKELINRLLQCNKGFYIRLLEERSTEKLSAMKGAREDASIEIPPTERNILIKNLFVPRDFEELFVMTVQAYAGTCVRYNETSWLITAPREGFTPEGLNAINNSLRMLATANPNIKLEFWGE